MTIDSNCLTGAIGEFSITDIIQLICLGGKSGRLALYNGPSGEGNLYFEYGYVVHAQSDGLEGEAAAQSLIARDVGTFEFSPGKAPPKKTVMLAGHELLMRAAQRVDEDAFLGNGGQLVLKIESSTDDAIIRTREQIKDLLKARLGRRSKQAIIAVQASDNTLDGLLETCERIEMYIALFVGEAVAEETGREMRKVMGQT